MSTVRGAATARVCRVLGGDFAGVVEAAGARARWAAGERVVGMTRRPIDGVGCRTGLVTVEEERCVELPDGVIASVSADQAAALGRGTAKVVLDPRR